MKSLTCLFILLLAACTRVQKTPEPPMTVDQEISRLLTQPAPQDWQPSSLTREHYLDVMERIVTLAATWQDERGAIIDPVDKSEHGQTSPRFVAPAAILLHAGRIPGLREKVYKGMDYATARLADAKAESPDFWMRELITAWHCLQDAPSQRRALWEKNLRRVDPEKSYRFVSNDPEKIKTFHNWVIYAAAGEAMRQAAGLGPLENETSIVWGQKFFEKYMPPQLEKFSDLGMYRDPGDPFTYDFTTRLQIMNGFASGYDSPLRSKFDDLLRRGAMAQLLYVSPNGYAPFGGRSSQMQMQEAILAAVCEREAVRYKTGNPRLAGAFKRMARVHVQSIERWIMDMDPPRHIKNGFPAEARHGIDPYGKVSVYSLFTASCLGLAYQYADDSIPEAPAPAEIGGYALVLGPAFHKVFASCQGTYIEIDTAADPHYDATGLGRFTRSGVPLELGLASPVTNDPMYLLPKESLPKEPLAIGPRWKTADGQWRSLAALGKDLSSKVQIERESPDEAIVRITWQTDGATITQRYTLTKGQLKIEAEVPSAAEVAFTIPLLKTDGQATAERTLANSSTTLHYRNASYHIAFPTNASHSVGPAIATRNGLYDILTLTASSNKITITLTLSP